MSELGDLLERMVCARDAYRTLRGELREWTHLGRSQEASRRSMQRYGGSVAVLHRVGTDDPEPPPVTHETRIRIWLSAPDRIRFESTDELEGRPRDQLLIIDGTTWWSDHSEMGSVTNAGDPGHLHGFPIGAGILDPVRLLPGSSVARRGTTDVAGRQAVVVQLTPRRGSQAAFADELDGLVSDEQELVIDRERGIVLRQTALLDGLPYHVTEFIEVHFDEPLTPDLFVFASFDGMPPTDTSTRRVGPAPLHDVAATAPFPVYAATAVPVGWRVTCSLHPASDRPPWPASVGLHYAATDGRAQVNVTELAIDDQQDEPTPDGRPWEVVRFRGVDYRTWEPVAPQWPSLVAFSLAGTAIRLTSADFDLRELLAFAQTFRRAPSDPPSL